jgi:hypothetical protein
MFNAARALPAGPGGQDEDVFPLRERLRFRDNFGHALREMRAGNASFRSLAKGPWALFIGIAVHWQCNAEAWPSQETLARFSGCTARSVRGYAGTLERDGFLRLRRERQANGSERIYYAPGPVLLTALAAFIVKYPKDRPLKVLDRRPPESPSGGPAETIAGTPEEAVSMEPKDQIRTSSSCETDDARAADPTEAALAPPVHEPPHDHLPEEEELMVTREDREIARIALAARMKRKHPKRAPPRWYDRADVEMVARCTAAIAGDREAKLKANREAIDGAFCASKEGPPTSRFIWARLEHFLEHVERGQLKAGSEERVARSRAQESQRVRPTQPWQPGPIAREASAAFRAELEEIKATAPPLFRQHLAEILAQCERIDRREQAVEGDLADGDEAPAVRREQVVADIERIFGPRMRPERAENDGTKPPGTQ